MATGIGQPVSEQTPYSLAENKNIRIRLSADGFYGSNSITNRFATDYILHRFISDELKSSVESVLSVDRNRFGSWFDGSADVMVRKDSSRTAFIATVQHHLFYDCLFAGDLFSLYFRGNKSFAGKTAGLDGSRFSSILYYQVGAGLSSQTENQKVSWHALGNIYLGHQLLDIESDNSTLYTAVDGSYLDADLELSFRQSDSLRTEPMTINGYGGGISCGASVQLSEAWTAFSSITNLGLIVFNDRSAVASIDTAFRFEGIQINELFDFNDSVQVFSSDSSYVEAYFTERNQKRIVRLVPGHLDIGFSKGFQKNRWTASFGARWFFTPVARPIIWAQGRRNWQHHQLAVKAQYGGYSGFNLGMGYVFDYKGVEFQVGSDVISSWLNTKKGTSMGAFVSLSKSF